MQEVGVSAGLICNIDLTGSVHVPADDFKLLAEKYGIDSSLIPRPLSKSGAFQRATTRSVDSSAFKDEPIICKEIKNDRQSIIRVFEKRLRDFDHGKTILEGKENCPLMLHVATLEYDKIKDQVSYTLFHQEGQGIIENVIEEYNKTAECYNIEQIRTFQQNGLKKFGCVKTRTNGGSDFVPPYYEQECRDFCRFLEDVCNANVTLFTIMNDENGKKSIKKALENDITQKVGEEYKKLTGKKAGVQELSDLICEFSIALQNKTKLKRDGIGSMITRFDEVMKFVEEYKSLLEDDLSVIEGQVLLTKQQLEQALKVIDGTV